jgi:hypothetical protein
VGGELKSIPSVWPIYQDDALAERYSQSSLGDATAPRLAGIDELRTAIFGA